MITARLTDHIWSTRKAESLNGLKLMQAEIIGGGTDTGNWQRRGEILGNFGQQKV